MIRIARGAHTLGFPAWTTMFAAFALVIAGCGETLNSPAAVTAVAPVGAAPEEKPLPAAASEEPLQYGEMYRPTYHLSMDDTGPASSVVLLGAEESGSVPLTSGGEADAVDTHVVPGVIGTALSFDGVDDSLAVPAVRLTEIFKAGSDFSVSFWWQSGGIPFPEGYRAILGNYAKDAGGFVLFQRGSADRKYNRLYMNFYVAGNSKPVLSPDVSIPEAEKRWHHFVFQREGSTLRAWRDGRLVAEDTGSGAAGDFGKGVDLRVEAARGGVAGALDDLRIFASAIPKSEIRRLASRDPEIDNAFLLAERLYDLKASGTAPAGEIRRIEAALAARLAAEQGFPKAIGDVMLLAFRYQFVVDNEYEMAFAFSPSKPLEKDYFIHIRGWVDPSHVPQVTELGENAGHGQKWEIRPEPPTSEWAPGEVVVVRSWVRAAPIPYRLSINFLEEEGDHLPLAHDYVDLSWQVGGRLKESGSADAASGR